MLSALVALTTFVIAGQTPGGPIRDTRPWNPANWDIDYQTIYEGTDAQTHWVIDQTTGQPKEVTVGRDWEDPLAPPIPPAAINSTNTPRTVRMSSNGTIKKRIKWIGVGDSPGKVLIKATATAGAYYKFSGTATASNGLGDPAGVWVGDGTLCESTGSSVRELPVNGSGVAELEISTTAYAESTGTDSYAKANAKGLNIEIADRFVTIQPWESPTYEPNPQDALPIPIVNLDPFDKRMNTAPRANPPLSEGNPYGIPDNTTFVLDSAYQAQPWGPWNNAVFGWSDGQSGQTIYRGLSYTVDQILYMMDHGPDVRTMTVTAHDSDGVTRDATVTVNVYAPCSNVTQTSDELTYGAWSRITSEVILSPGETVTFLEGTTTVKAVTKKVMNTIGGEIGGTIKDLLTIKLTGNRQWGQDDTAQLARLKQINQTTGPYSALTMVWLERRAFWMERWGWDHVYTANGYQGVDVWNYKYWVSGTKEQAEMQDAQQKVGKLEIE